jgi:predicted lipid-binding transport protein (Tim44 family)
MSDGFQLFDILLFAAIAGFLVIRLRSVLGRRTGNEQRRDPFAAPPPRPTAPQRVPPATPRGPVIEGTATPVPQGLKGVAAIAAADPSFDETTFLKGARSAFEIIVNAFAAGDTAAMQPLLSKEVYEPFAAALRERAAAKEKHETTLMSIKAADIVEAVIEGGTALVTVKFVSDQVNVTRGEDGAVRDGDPDRIVETTDVWTFARPLRSRDPNWTLVATHTP